MPQWAYPAFVIVAGIAGFAVTFGTMKAFVVQLRKEVDRLKENTDELKEFVSEVREEMRVRFASLESRGIKVLNGGRRKK